MIKSHHQYYFINYYQNIIISILEQRNILSSKEARFGRSWAGIVDFIATCNFKCDLITTDILQNLLPPRTLNEDDQVPFISDISHLQNRALLFIDGLYTLNRYLHSLM